jgi:hypothetical protein
MATIYIDPTRSTNGTGTFSDPRNTWSGVTWTAGNTYLQKAGTTWTSAGTAAISVSVTGTSGSRITLGSYDGGNAQPTTEKAYVRGGTRYGIQLQTGVNFVTIQDFDIANVGDGTNTNFGITWVATNDTTDSSVYVYRCDIHDLVPSASVDVNGISARGANNIIADCRFWNIPTDAMFGRGNNFLIERNYATMINTDGRNQGDCFQVGGSGADSTGLIVRNNYFDASNGQGKQAVIIESVGSAHTISDNTLIGAVNAQQGIFSDAPVTVERNFIYDCIHGVRVNGGASTIRNNVLINNKSDNQDYKAIWLNSDGHTAENNTMVTAFTKLFRQSGVYVDDDDTGHTIKNNIIVGFYWGIRTGGTSLQEEAYNCFFNNEVDVADDGNARSLGTGSFVENPLFDPRYKPTKLRLAHAGNSVTGNDVYNQPYKGNTIGAVNMGYNGFRSIFKSTEAVGNKEDFGARR